MRTLLGMLLACGCAAWAYGLPFPHGLVPNLSLEERLARVSNAGVDTESDVASSEEPAPRMTLGSVRTIDLGALIAAVAVPADAGAELEESPVSSGTSGEWSPPKEWDLRDPTLQERGDALAATGSAQPEAPRPESAAVEAMTPSDRGELIRRMLVVYSQLERREERR